MMEAKFLLIFLTHVTYSKQRGSASGKKPDGSIFSKGPRNQAFTDVVSNPEPCCIYNVHLFMSSLCNKGMTSTQKRTVNCGGIACTKSDD